MKLTVKLLSILFVGILMTGFVSSCSDEEPDPIRATSWYFGGEEPAINTGDEHYDQIIATALSLKEDKNQILVLSDKDTIVGGKDGFYSCLFQTEKRKYTGYYSIIDGAVTVYNYGEVAQYIMDPLGTEMVAMLDRTTEVQRDVENAVFEGVPTDTEVGSAIIARTIIKKK